MKTKIIRHGCDDKEFNVPETYIECDGQNCHECAIFIEGTHASRFFASKFHKEDCYTRSNFPRPSWDDPYWNKYDSLTTF